MNRPKVAFTVEFEEVSETHPPWSRDKLLVLYAKVRRHGRADVFAQTSRVLPDSSYLREGASEVRRAIEMQLHVDVLRMVLGEVETE